MNFSTLLPRVVTALVVLALIGLAFWFGVVWMLALAFVCAALALWEFYHLFWPGGTHLADKLLGLGMAVVVFAGAWLEYAAMHWGVRIYPLLPGAVALCLLIVAIAFLIRYGSGSEADDGSGRLADDGSGCLADAALTLMGVLYVPFSLVLALLLPRNELLLLVAVVAATDTCAYLVGSLWGKRRLWPRVSPKKSVEGCAGGILGSVLACLGFGLYAGTAMGISVCLGIYLAIFAILGDLFESALKRAHDVKDSGALLPGHGGMLDRLDSFLFVAPAYAILNLLARLP
jgi:phosphatidate cytidylyltransferase